MALDRKYGKVTTERGAIGEDEPVVVFRARDKLLPSVLAHYMTLCVNSGSPNKHLKLVQDTMLDVMDWQEENETQVPRSDSYEEESSVHHRDEEPQKR